MDLDSDEFRQFLEHRELMTANIMKVLVLYNQAAFFIACIYGSIYFQHGKVLKDWVLTYRRLQQETRFDIKVERRAL